VARQKRYDEQLTLRVGLEPLAELARAREATLELGGVALPLERKHLALLDAAHRRIELARP
jgi:hypothetical protein